MVINKSAIHHSCEIGNSVTGRSKCTLVCGNRRSSEVLVNSAAVINREIKTCVWVRRPELLSPLIIVGL